MIAGRDRNRRGDATRQPRRPTRRDESRRGDRVEGIASNPRGESRRRRRAARRSGCRGNSRKAPPMLRNCSSAFELSTAAAETGRSVVSGLALSCVCGGVTTARGATDARAALTRVARARSAAVPRCPDANDAPAFDRADDARHRADAAHATAGAAHAEDDMMREGTLTKIHARAGDESPHAVPCVRRECRGIDATGTENPCSGDRRHRDAADGRRSSQ